MKVSTAYCLEHSAPYRAVCSTPPRGCGVFAGCRGPPPDRSAFGLFQTSRSPPGCLILWKATAGIINLNLVRKVWSPSPKDKIGHVGFGSVRKGRHENPCTITLQETFGQRPGRWDSPLREIKFPRTVQFSQTHVVGLPANVISQIRKVIDVDIVRTNCQRIEAVREAMSHLGKHAINCKGEV